MEKRIKRQPEPAIYADVVMPNGMTTTDLGDTAVRARAEGRTVVTYVWTWPTPEHEHLARVVIAEDATLGDISVLRALLERAGCSVELSHGGPFATAEA